MLCLEYMVKQTMKRQKKRQFVQMLFDPDVYDDQIWYFGSMFGPDVYYYFFKKKCWCLRVVLETYYGEPMCLGYKKKGDIWKIVEF